MLNLDKKKKYLLACSCGPDSMALFFLLKKEGFTFDVAHVNYHIRNESDLEQKTLEKYCSKNSTKLFVFNVSKTINKNIEEECREIRYNFFAQVMKDRDYDALLVAHHQDDLIETYLLQQNRKILPKYYGIARENVIFNIIIIRPLLNFTKSHLLEICNDNNVPYHIDITNNLDIYERNKIRHKIVENLTDEDRKKYIEEINDKNAALLKMFLMFKNENYYDIKNLINIDDKTLAYCINYLLEKNGCQKAVSLRQTTEIKKILKSNKTTVYLKITNDYLLAKEYGKLKCYKNSDVSYEYILEKPSLLNTPYFYSNILKTNEHGIKMSDYPISISNKFINSEKVDIKNYQVIVRRLYIDWKMPIPLRSIWPIVRNNEGKIIFIPRYRVDFKITESLDFYVKCVSLGKK